MNRSALLAFAILCVTNTAWGQLFSDSSRSWVSRDGRSRVVGTLEGLSEDQLTVTLKRSDNQKMVQVPLERLSAVDYLFVCDHVRRSAAGGSEQEFGQFPMAMRSGQKTTDRWRLSPAISIHLPPGTVIWRLISSQPMLYGAFAVDDDRLPDLTVLFEPDVFAQTDRLKRIQEQNEATLRFLEERGINQPSGRPLQADPTISFQKSLMSGTDLSDQELFCETHLRFDYQGMLVFRAYGNADQVKSMVRTIDDFRYLDVDDLDAGPIEAEPEVSAEAQIPSHIPADIYKEFEAFREHAMALLSRANNAKEVIERLSDPVGLAKLKSNQDRWDSAVISFDVRKRLRLKTTLQSLDWKTASYSAQDRVMAFSLPDEIRFSKSDQGWRIINRYP